MARDLRKIRRGFIAIPKNIYEPRFKVTITNNNGEEINVTSDLLGLTTTRRATIGIGQFNVKLLNTDGKYINLFDAGNIIKIYHDYNPNPGSDFTPSTLRFKGHVDNYFYSENDSDGWIITLNGRDYPQLLDKTVSLKFEGTDASEAIKAVISELNSFYSTDIITTNNVTEDLTSIYASYNGMTYWSIIKDICDRIEYDCFIDVNGDLHTFPRDSKDDYNNYAIIGINVKKVNSFGADSRQVKNYVVIKSKENNLGYMWLSQDTDNQNKTWVKGGEFSDYNISTIKEAQDKADVIKNRSLQTETLSGSLVLIGNYDLTPGYSIPCRIPLAGIDGMMTLATITDTFDINRGFVTTVQLNEVKRNTAMLFKQTQKEIENLSAIENPNQMEYSFLMKFDKENIEDNFISSLPDGMNISEGKLIMNATSNTLEVQTTTQTFPEDIKRAEILVDGEATAASSYEISFQEGKENTFQSIIPGTNNAINVSSPGKKMVLKIIAVSDSFNTNPKWDTIIVRCKS